MARVVAPVDLGPTRTTTSLRCCGFSTPALGGGPAGSRPAEFFRWKHLENPFGRSFMLVAEADGRIVGLRAFMRWEFVAGDGAFRAVRAVDTATHPDYPGAGDLLAPHPPRRSRTCGTRRTSSSTRRTRRACPAT